MSPSASVGTGTSLTATLLGASRKHASMYSAIVGL
jgi:hypothetical protein